MPTTTLETLEATWDRPRSTEEISNFLGPRLVNHALVDVDVEAENFDVDAMFKNVE